MNLYGLAHRPRAYLPANLLANVKENSADQFLALTRS